MPTFLLKSNKEAVFWLQSCLYDLLWVSLSKACTGRWMSIGSVCKLQYCEPLYRRVSEGLGNNKRVIQSIYGCRPPYIFKWSSIYGCNEDLGSKQGVPYTGTYTTVRPT